MSTLSLVRKNGLPWFDYLLIAGVILAPMTGLRIWKIGPSELLCAVWCFRYILYIIQGKFDHFLTKFWVPFFVTLLAGTGFCLLYYPAESSGIEGITTWFFLLFFSLGLLQGLRQHSLQNILKILEKICFGAAIWYPLMWIYSLNVSRFFLGARLWYSTSWTRFTGGADNPHQLALLTLGLTFVSFYFISRVSITKRRKFFHALCIAVFLFLLSMTRSTTAWMAMFFSGAFGIAVMLVMKKQAIRSRQLTALLSLLFFSTVLVLGFSQLYSAFINWVSSDSNGLHRFKLFAYIVEPLQKNPFFGLGDGIHSNSGTMGFHNSYLEVIAMTGLIGFTLFTVFSVRLFRGLAVDPFLLLTPLAMYVYGLAGFGLRRLPFWALVTALAVVAEKLTNEKKAPLNEMNPDPQRSQRGYFILHG